MGKLSRRGRDIAVRRSQNRELDAKIAELEEQGAKFRGQTRQSLCALIGAIAEFLQQVEETQELLVRLRKHKFFADMHVKPKEPYRLAAQFALRARTDNQRAQANRYGRAIVELRRQGEPTESIARRLGGLGGIRAVLQAAKLEALGVKPELEAEPAPKQIASSKLARAEREQTDDGDEELEGNDEDEEADTGSGGSRRLPAIVEESDDDQEEGEVDLHVTCLIPELLEILGARDVTLKVRIKQGEGWKPVTLLEHEIDK